MDGEPACPSEAIAARIMPPLMTWATCRLRGGQSSHSADEPNSDSQISNLAETDHASIHGYHGEGNASAFQFLTQAVHRLGRAYRQWISAHGETEPPPPRLEFPPPVRWLLRPESLLL